MIVELAVNIPKAQQRPSRARHDLTRLADEQVRDAFCEAFVNNVPEESELVDADNMASQIADAMKAAAEHIPKRTLTPKRPWISSRTLQLIENRNAARLRNQAELEQSRKHQADL